MRDLWLNESKNKNFVLSPFSIDTALGLLASGACGESLKQILAFLNSEIPENINYGNSKHIESLCRTWKEPKLSFVSGVWIDESCPIKPSFKEVATAIYKAEAETVDFTNQSLVPTGEFKVPKFKILFNLEASRVLKELGLVFPFDPSKAELMDMVNITGKLHVEKVFHKCFVEVDEEGTEVAAATAFAGGYGARPAPKVAPPPRVDSVVDHPFMFIIQEEKVVWLCSWDMSLILC
ncbi:serpin-Z2B-like [Papaver somniferum]|uniref:serpin-Z2B-like n=1 Tax=Papaver somniferum TaxID=3469 RepID=UPI000E6FB0A1|nr:serpin-Z2B-like [Papaver somniferum]